MNIAETTAPTPMNTRIDVINALIAARGYKRYLEIGCQNDDSFSRVEAPERVGIDPVSGGTLRMTSDEFFAQNQLRFDIIFIDGDHRHEQSVRDVDNALGALSLGGAIVMHDCLPPEASYERTDRCGTVWRSFAYYRQRRDLDAIVGDFDFGVGIIRRGVNPSPIVLGCSLEQLTFAALRANRDAWMRPRTPAGVRAFISSTWRTEYLEW